MEKSLVVVVRVIFCTCSNKFPNIQGSSKGKKQTKGSILERGSLHIFLILIIS